MESRDSQPCYQGQPMLTKVGIGFCIQMSITHLQLPAHSIPVAAKVNRFKTI